jgi:hypothetical protein
MLFQPPSVVDTVYIGVAPTHKHEAEQSEYATSAG